MQSYYMLQFAKHSQELNSLVFFLMTTSFYVD